MEPRGKSDLLEGHTQPDCVRVHHARLAADGRFAWQDECFATEPEPGHDARCALCAVRCAREQDFVLRAIVEDIELMRQTHDAVQSLRICIGADGRVRTGMPVQL